MYNQSTSTSNSDFVGQKQTRKTSAASIKCNDNKLTTEPDGILITERKKSDRKSRKVTLATLVESMSTMPSSSASYMPAILLQAEDSSLKDEDPENDADELVEDLGSDDDEANLTINTR